MESIREYRVVHVGAIQCEYDPFKVFGTDRMAAILFMEKDEFICSKGGKMRLESRLISEGPRDWKAETYTTEEAIQATSQEEVPPETEQLLTGKTS